MSKARSKDKLLLFTYILISTIMLFIQSYNLERKSINSIIEGMGTYLLSPFQHLFNAMYSTIYGTIEGITKYKATVEELKKLQEKLSYYEKQYKTLERIKKENEILRKLLKLKTLMPYKTILAEVVGRNPDNWYRDIIINRGESDGIKKDMPVIAYSGPQKGLVGKIIATGKFYSKILPIISPNSGVAIRVKNSNFAGILTGYSLQENTCQIKYIYSIGEIKIGDEIITSGEFSIYPKDIPIGTIIEIKKNVKGMQKILVKPYINIGSIKRVFIILKPKEKEIKELLNK